MGKKSKRKRKHRQSRQKAKVVEGGVTMSWQEQDGYHMLVPGRPPSAETMEEITRDYQQRLRNSPLWPEMVKKYGKEQAEELLKECRVELRPTHQGIFSRIAGLFRR